MQNFFLFIGLLAKKLILYLALLFLLAIVVFYVSRITPGDPLQSFYGEATQSMTEQDLTDARIRLGLNDSIYIQFSKWIKQALQGDFGISLRYKRPVIDVVRPLISNTLILSITAYSLIFLLALTLVFICALYEESWIDKFICRIGTTLYYIPAFWLAIVFILIFSVNLKIFPSSGAYSHGKSLDVTDRIRHLVLPVIIMVSSHLWYYAYMMRNKLLDELRKDYILLARAKGLSKIKILWHHCIRNIIPSIINIAAISIPHIFSGTYVIEAVFNYPGIGALAVSSAKYHDYNLLMLMVLLTSTLVMLSSIVAQVISEIIDPRMKSQKGIYSDFS